MTRVCELVEKAEEFNQQVIQLYKQGRYQEAIKIAKNVLAIYEKNLEPNHLYVATGLNNLASLYKSLGDYTKAEPLYVKVKIFPYSFGG